MAVVVVRIPFSESARESASKNLGGKVVATTTIVAAGSTGVDETNRWQAKAPRKQVTLKWTAATTGDFGLSRR